MIVHQKATATFTSAAVRRVSSFLLTFFLKKRYEACQIRKLLPWNM